jgi:hypothetical protein
VNAPASQPAADQPHVDLRDPYLAAFLAWLLPGAGHFYQRRWGKGGLFMVCILTTFFVGLWMGQGRVVYASWRPNDQRYAYICQVGVGLPALPALVQAMRLKSGEAPFWNGAMAPPFLPGQRLPRKWVADQVAKGNLDASDFPELSRAEPADYVEYLCHAEYYTNQRGEPAVQYSDEAPKFMPSASTREPYNQLSDWNLQMGPYFELGTVYTLIAGLLNVLAIFDALAGPAPPTTPAKHPDPKPAPAGAVATA